MKSLFNRWKSLSAEHKDYIRVYTAGMVWFLAYMIFPPATTITFIGYVLIWLWCGVSVAGGAIALYGLLTRDNLLRERLGVTLMSVGPLVYCFIQLSLFIYLIFFPDQGNPWARFHLIFLAIWPYFFLRKRSQYLKRLVVEAKKTPTKTELENY